MKNNCLIIYYLTECYFDTSRRQVQKLERRFRKTRSRDDRKTWTSAQWLMQKKYAGKAEQYWSSKIASQKNNSRDLWSSVNRLLGGSKELATTDLTAKSFKHSSTRKSNTFAPTLPMLLPRCMPHHRDAYSQSLTRSVLKKTIEFIHKAPLKQSALDPIPTWILKKCASELAPFI